MTEIKIPVKFEKLRRSFSGVTRWNVCQKLARMLYRSNFKDEELDDQLKHLEKEYLINNKEENEK